MSIVPRFTRRQTLRHAVAGGALLGGGLARPLVVAASAQVADPPAAPDQPASGSAALLRATADALRADAFLEPTDSHWGHAINRAYVRAAASGGGEIVLPAGRLPAFAPDCVLSPKSDVILRGTGGGTVLTPYHAPPIEVVAAVDGLAGFGFRDLTLDLMDLPTVDRKRTTAMSFRNTERMVLGNVTLNGWLEIGLGLNGVRDLVATRLHTRPTKADPRWGMAVDITRNGANLSADMRFRDCLFDGAGVDILGSNILFEGCHARDYRFGAGFVSEIDPACENLTFIACVASGARGTDGNGYTCGGFEMWAPYTRMIGCRVADVGGTGVEWGSRGGVMADCTISDVGRSTGGSPAISLRHGGGDHGAWNASYSRLSNIIVYDGAGAAGTTTYAIEDQGDQCTGISIDATALRLPLRRAPLRILSRSYTIETPTLTASTLLDPVVLGRGRHRTIAVPCAGARVGDAVTAHAHGDLDGCTIAADVVDADAVALTLRNDTDGARPLAGARVSMTCRKPPDFAFF